MKDLIVDVKEDIGEIFNKIKEILICILKLIKNIGLIFHIMFFSIFRIIGFIVFKLWGYTVSLCFLPVILLFWVFNQKEASLKELIKRDFEAFDIFGNNCIFDEEKYIK